MSKSIILTWKEARHHTIGASSGTAKDAEGKPAKPHPVVRLMPGANTVNYDDWCAVKNLPIIRYYLAKELLIEGDVLDGELTTLAEMKPAAAVKFVGETLDKKRLEGWLEAEERGQVRAAIEKRVAYIDSQRRDDKRPTE